MKLELAYQDDLITLYHGDARDMDAIPDASSALAVMSPPYYNARVYSQWPTYEAYLADMMVVWRECHRVIIDGGRICVNVVPEFGYGDDYKNMHLDIGNQIASLFTLFSTIIWSQSETGGANTAWGSWRSPKCPNIRGVHEVIFCAGKGGRRRLEKGESDITSKEFTTYTKSVWNMTPVKAKNAWHPARFPTELPKRLIKLLSYTTDTILDPFAGSGTTLMVARMLGRKSIGVELSREYVDRMIIDLEHGRESGGQVAAAKAEGFTQERWKTE